MRWIWEDENWPAFNVNEALLGPVLDRLEGCARDFERRVGGQFARSPEDSGEFELDLLVDSVMDSYAIEEEHLSRDSVRSSFIRAFWPSRQTLKPGDTQTRALAELYRELWKNAEEDLTHEVLHRWHEALIAPDDVAYSLRELRRGAYRTSAQPIQVVSRGDRVHFEAPPAAALHREMALFLDWVNTPASALELNPWLKLAYAHLWFLTLHPYDDGNGRMARVLSDWMMMRMQTPSRALVSMTGSIQAQREAYYEHLEQAQRGGVVIDDWCAWFLERAEASFVDAGKRWDRSLERTRKTSIFWKKYSPSDFSPEQRKLVERLLQGGDQDFPDGITRRQYKSLAGVSDTTATKHLQLLVELGVLRTTGQMKSTRYQLNSDIFL